MGVARRALQVAGMAVLLECSDATAPPAPAETVATVTVSPVTVLVGQQAQLTAILRDRAGHVLAGGQIR